jgi:hypothetical protein
MTITAREPKGSRAFFFYPPVLPSPHQTGKKNLTGQKRINIMIKASTFQGYHMPVICLSGEDPPLSVPYPIV